MAISVVSGPSAKPRSGFASGRRAGVVEAPNDAAAETGAVGGGAGRGRTIAASVGSVAAAGAAGVAGAVIADSAVGGTVSGSIAGSADAAVSGRAAKVADSAVGSTVAVSIAGSAHAAVSGKAARVADSSAGVGERLRARLTTLAPGLALTLAAVAVATAANRVYPSLSPLTAAVVLGVLAANLLPRAALAAARPGLTVAAKRVMRCGIVLLGLQLAVGDVLGLGWEALVLVVVVVGATFFGTRWLGRRMDLPGRQPLLIATGFAICGASAVAAMEAVTRRRDTPEDDPDPLVAIALVTLCGSLAIVVLPLLKGPLGLGDVTYGHWVGASVHDIGQVVAAAGTGGAAAVKPAVVVKLMRVAMLAPMVAGAALAERRRANAAGAAAAGTDGAADVPQGRRPPILPLFVVGFLAMIALRSTGVLPAAAVGHAKQLQDLLLAAGMFGLGAGVRIGELRRTGVRPLLLGLASWLLIAAVAYVGVRLTG